MPRLSKSICPLAVGMALIALLGSGCASTNSARHERYNIQKYCWVWDQIVNQGRLDLFNDTNFTSSVVMHVKPEDLAGIGPARDYYANFIKGFSEIRFTIVDCFGQGDRIVKHWRFKGRNTGEFFGMPATGRAVDIEGVTLVRMEGGRIAEEQDFYDNLELNTQLGLTQDPAK